MVQGLHVCGATYFMCDGASSACMWCHAYRDEKEWYPTSSSLYTDTHDGASKLQRLRASSTSPRHSGQLPGCIGGTGGLQGVL